MKGEKEQVVEVDWIFKKLIYFEQNLWKAEVSSHSSVFRS